MFDVLSQHSIRGFQFDRTLHTCDRCQGFESWIFDMNLQRGGFRCLSCHPESLGEQVLNIEVARFSRQVLSRNTWSPPTGIVIVPINSFFIVRFYWQRLNYWIKGIWKVGEIMLSVLDGGTMRWKFYLRTMFVMIRHFEMRTAGRCCQKICWRTS